LLVMLFMLVCLQMWRYEGQNTLAYYLRRRDTLRALARDLDVPEDIVVPVAMRQLLLGLAALHSAGLVHRYASAVVGAGWMPTSAGAASAWRCDSGSWGWGFLHMQHGEMEQWVT
jgi:hypothetical protein